LRRQRQVMMLIQVPLVRPPLVALALALALELVLVLVLVLML